jgi:MoaA/NifB/PqqE/SkfB family radical SAM enzyme
MCMVAFSKEPSYSSRVKVDNFKGTPKWAYIEICEYCSHECPWCYGSFNDQNDSFMSLELFQKIVNNCVSNGISQVTLTGGEPTEHPLFKKFIEYLSNKDVIIHIASHGEHITLDLATFLKKHNVKQVQFNYQGSIKHDSIHKKQGSFLKQVAGIKNTLAVGIEATTTTTFGKYNLLEVPAIIDEAISLGVNRVRVWETTGSGSGFLKDIEISEAFKDIKEYIELQGYANSLSYEPLVTGTLNAHCPTLLGMMITVKVNGDVIYCCAVENKVPITNVLDPNFVTIYLEYMSNIKNKYGIYCEARTPKIEKTIKFFKPQ